MKKFMLLALAGLLGLSAAAATKDDLRIYINPGHGSWTANDRPMPVKGHGAYSRYNTDTTSFFESNTNLRKGFGVLEKLRAMGLKFDPTLNQTGDRHTIGAARDMSNNIVMSHVKCGPYHDDNGTATQLGDNTPADLYYYNRSLSEIGVEVDANNFDMFISIHSNAVDSGGWKTTNFPIILYRGYDDCRAETGVADGFSATCKAMAQKAWPYHIKNIHEGWTHYTNSTNIRGDIDYYHSSSTVRGFKGYLGVLKHGTPGFLIEGYFHQYAPAALRHMNWDVNYIEGYNYAHGIADYFGIQKENVGDIYGVVRDEHERYNDADYVPLPTHADAYMPLDGVNVTLKKGNNVVATYTTDNQFNGAFVFHSVAPGTYTIELSKEGYKTPEPMEVTVAAATVSYPEMTMESESYVPPTITYTDYPDDLVGTQFGAREEYSFAQAIVDKEISQLEGTTIRRMLCVQGKLYILAHKAETAEPVIVVLDSKTLEVLATPGTEGAEGTEQNIADIAVSADGVLLASAKELCQFDASQVRTGETRGECNVYRWTNDEAGLPEGNPQLLVSTMLSGNFYRAYSGGSMAYHGTISEGTVILSAENANSGGKVFYSFVNVVDGAKASEGISNNSYFNHEQCGPFTLNISPLNGEHIIVDSPTFLPMQVNIPGKVLDAQMPEGIVNVEGTAPGFFRYAGHVYMVSTDNTEAGNGGVVLVDITEGVDKAVLVPTVNTSLDVLEGTSAAAGMQVVTRDDYEKVNSANMALFLVRGNKVSRFTTEGVRQPQPRREFAYGIVMEENDGDYTVTYNSTGDAVAANIVLTNKENEEDVVIIPAGAVVKGENTASFNRADLEGRAYSLAVAIQSKPIAQLGEYYADPNGVTKRGGVITITNPEYDSFGYTLVATGGNNGVKVYAPDGTVTGPFLANDSRLDANNQSSMFRGDERDGMAVFCDWSDKGAGYWVIDPLNPTTMYQLLGGERSGTKGSYAYNGEIIGGGSSCVAFQGTGAETRMYSFLEDYPQGNMPGAENKVGRYDIGTDYQITRVPDMIFDNLTGAKNLANQNVEIDCTPDGFFATQKRASGANLAGTAAFYYADSEGNILYSSHVIQDIISSNTGIAISGDLKYLAMGEYDRIDIFKVSWTDGEPEFELMATVDNPAAGDDFSHMRFDAGNNLHVYHRMGEGYHAYSLPDAAPTTVVPAKSIYVVEGSNTGVEDIVVEDNGTDADAVYYNLSGVRVSGTLTPGLYIKVTGDEATKVVIR